MRETSLSAIHVLINVSSRENSSNTSSNAALAPTSSAVDAVSVSVEPIDRREDETSAPAACAAEDGAEEDSAAEDDSSLVQPSAAMHVRAAHVIRRAKNLTTTRSSSCIRF